MDFELVGDITDIEVHWYEAHGIGKKEPRPSAMATCAGRRRSRRRVASDAVAKLPHRGTNVNATDSRGSKHSRDGTPARCTMSLWKIASRPGLTPTAWTGWRSSS